MKYIFFILSFYSSFIFAQLSPGDLTTAHAELEGLSNCTKCHELGESVLDSKCLNCHGEINNLISAGRGYHSSKEVKSKKCFDCHSEHNGRSFRIINFESKKFNHDKTGYTLLGKHKEIECKNCHKAEHIKEPKLASKKGTFLGLDEDCADCHKDVHKSTLGNNCESCHGFSSFKPAINFDHANTKFKLTGKHLNTDCVKCHKIETNKGIKFQIFKGIEFSTCKSCHTDIHKEKLGNNCRSCHVTSSFHTILNKKQFDHRKTNFPLIGKHKKVNCKSCHNENDRLKLKYKYCYNCHTDYHRGEFVKAGKMTDCSYCHTESGFSPSSFTVAMHNKTKFGLVGSHLAVPCQKCHSKNSKWVFRLNDSKCISCHVNVHKDKISKKFFGDNECTNCHNTERWNAVSFDHSKTNFNLLGKHSKIKCGECHYVNTIDGYSQVFNGLNKDCVTCHKDIHYGQFNNAGDVCSECHSFNSFKPDKFDHSKTRFKIDGAHTNIPCSKCHKQVNEDGNTFVLYKINEFKCSDCHK